MTKSAIEHNIKEIRAIARAHGATRIRVFGSHAKGIANEPNDLDLLIDLGDVIFSFLPSQQKGERIWKLCALCEL